LSKNALTTRTPLSDIMSLRKY